MARKKTDTTQVRLTVDVVDSARIIAALKDEPMTDFLSDLLRPILARMEAEEMDKRTAGRMSGSDVGPSPRPRKAKT